MIRSARSRDSRTSREVRQEQALVIAFSNSYVPPVKWLFLLRSMQIFRGAQGNTSSLAPARFRLKSPIQAGRIIFFPSPHVMHYILWAKLSSSSAALVKRATRFELKLRSVDGRNRSWFLSRRSRL